jgi:hypothetical protein
MVVNNWKRSNAINYALQELDHYLYGAKFHYALQELDHYLFGAKFTIHCDHAPLAIF